MALQRGHRFCASVCIIFAFANFCRISVSLFPWAMLFAVSMLVAMDDCAADHGAAFLEHYPSSALATR